MLLPLLFGIGGIVQGMSMINMMKQYTVPTSSIPTNIYPEQTDSMATSSLTNTSNMTQEIDSMVENIANKYYPNNLKLSNYYLSLMPSDVQQYWGYDPLTAQQSMKDQLKNYYTTTSTNTTSAFQSLLQKKDQTFQAFQCNFDSFGEPFKDSNNFLVLYPNIESGETAENKSCREGWESKETAKLEASHLQQKTQIISNSMKDLSSYVKGNICNLYNPEVQKEIQTMVTKIEYELKEHQYKYQQDVLKAGMPTYELKKEIEKLLTQNRDDEKDFLASLEESPEGQCFCEYQEAVKEFLAEQKYEIAQNIDDPTALYSHSMLSMVIPTSDDPELAKALQGLVNEVAEERRYG